MANFSINYLGFVPRDPERLPFSKNIFGKGTSRPIGIPANNFHELYWKTKIFSVAIIGAVGGDPLLNFLASGGGSGTIIGAIAGLNAAAGGGSSSIDGKTKIRKVRNYSRKFVTSNPTKITNQNLSNYQSAAANVLPVKTSVNNVTERLAVDQIKDGDPILESLLCSSGPQHTLNQSGNSILIDFSDVIYANRLYWPTIIISLNSQGAIITSESSGGLVEVIGGVTFANYGVISMFSSPFSAGLNTLTVVNGQISVGNTCQSKFYYDDKDAERKAAGCQ